jgi:hypothetical protein
MCNQPASLSLQEGGLVFSFPSHTPQLRVGSGAGLAIRLRSRATTVPRGDVDSTGPGPFPDKSLRRELELGCSGSRAVIEAWFIGHFLVGW